MPGNYKTILFNATILMLLIASCKEDAPENPCKNQHSTTAAFTMMETFQPFQYTSGWVYYDTDTALCGDITFTAQEINADSFIWQIGTDPKVRNGKQVTVLFPSSVAGSTIDIRLIVIKKPNKLCFPYDVGTDTVIRQLYFVSTDKANWVGKWHGYNIDQPDSIFNIELVWGYDTFGNYYTFMIKGLPFGCSNFTSHFYAATLSISYKTVDFINYDGIYCNNIGGILNTKGDSVGINYSIMKSVTHGNPNDRFNKTFIGKRIP